MNISRVVMHRDVSRAMAGKIEMTPGLEILCRIRRTLRERKQARANAREEAQHPMPPGAEFRGLPKYDPTRRLHEALAAGGLSEELVTIIREETARKGKE